MDFRFLRTSILRSNGIDYFEEWKLIEIGISGANSPDAVFAHENGRVCVVEYIAGKVRQLQKNFFGNISVSFCWDKNCEARRGEQRRNEVHAAGALHGRRMTRAWVVTRRNS
jgi:hypothetical protein